MTATGLMILLLAIWVLLWGSLTVANVLSGIAVVLLVLVVVPDVKVRLGKPTIRPLAIGRLAVRIITDIFRANWVVTSEILTPQSSVNTAVVKVPLPYCSDGVLTFVANVLSLTPGTMPLEVTRTPPAIYVHILHLHDLEAVRIDVQALGVLAVRAFGTDEAIAGLESLAEIEAHRAADASEAAP